MFKAIVIEDSINPRGGHRLTTLQLEYPRFIHAEVLTHRVFSRNSSSSRAIPVPRMIKQVREDPAMPIHWGKNQPGMQAQQENDSFVMLPDSETGAPYPHTVQDAWRFAADGAAGIAYAMHEAGYHKQVVNRILEPFQWMKTIVSATEWDNFFALRCHPDAQPEFQLLACMIREAMQNSVPVERDYHLPYVSEEERKLLTTEVCMRISTARCARVSYLTHEGKVPVIDEDMKLYERLVGSDPIHASPTEHPAKRVEFIAGSGNFKGWKQHREEVEYRALLRKEE